MSREKNDLTLKVFAFIIAVVLWSYVMSEVNPVRSDDIKNISVTFNNMQALERQGLALMNPKEAKVSVKVTGKKSDLAEYSTELAKLIKAEVDLSGYSEGQRKVPINVTIDELSNIKIDSYEPKEILITFDKLITKYKDVTIKTTGSLEPGYVLGDPSTKTQKILIEGPRTWVNEVSEIIAFVDLKGRKENSNVTLPIKLVDDEGNDVIGLKYEPSVIDINIPVFRTVTLPIVLETVNELPPNYEISGVVIKPNRIAIKGDNSIANLMSIQTKPVDINSLMENTDIVVELDLPENVVQLNPNEKVTVSLTIEEAFTKTFNYSLEELEIRNLKEGVALDNENYSQAIEIIVKGSNEIIEDLTKEDLEVYLDLYNLGEGLHKTYISFSVPEGVTVKHITPQPIELKLINR